MASGGLWKSFTVKGIRDVESLCDKLIGANDLADTQPVYQTSCRFSVGHCMRLGCGGGGGMESKTLPFLRGKVMSVLAQMLS